MTRHGLVRSLTAVVLLVAAQAGAQTVIAPAEWRAVQGALKVEGDRLVLSGGGPAVAVLPDRQFDDFVLEVEMLRPNKGYVGVSVRRQKGSDPWPDAYYFASLRPRHFRVIRKRGGKYDPPLSESEKVSELAANAVVRLKVWARGDHFRAWINGRLVANVRDEEPFLSGGAALTVGSGAVEPPARFGGLVISNVEAVPPPKPDEIPPLGLAETLQRGERVVKDEIPAVKARLAEASGQGLDDAALQRQAGLVHALLWRYYFDARTNMVYTILEPHSGRVVLPSPDDVLKDVPNANGWSTAIEDCAGYGNGRHLAWLVERSEVTRKPDHAAEARRLLEGLLLLSAVRPADHDGFAELVRGVLPDGRTYYRGKEPGSSGDNYNGYSYGLWRFARSPLAAEDERRRIAIALDRTAYRTGGFPAFAAIAADVTQSADWRGRYEERRRAGALRYAAWSIAERAEAASWTAVQLQLQLTALLGIEKDPQTRAAFEHARRANAWSRWKDVIAGLSFDERVDAYMHRVDTVRNPLDGMLAVMLTGDREIIDAFLPVFRRVVAGFDFAAFRDQRQLTPFLGVYWLGVRYGVFARDASLPEPSTESARLKPLDPNRNLIVTYFPECNPKPPR